ncbi:MAG TPA: hypothetical protein PL009_03555 [Flavipsychrobacter sp.]|nr:hypothetical protein [Flavipsychrobacter sp.]
MTNSGNDGGYLRSNADNSVFNIAASTDGPWIELYGKNFPPSPWDARAGAIRFVSRGSIGEGFSFINYDPQVATWRRTMMITNDNRVFIGSSQPSGNFANYKLGVDGLLVTKRLVVQTNSWADFVFEPTYNLMPLNEVEDFIKKHHRLPDMPAEEAVLENGIDISEMNKLLLQKVEELTLYMIELKKENDLIKAKMNKQ